jgi:hypothetical protein
MSALSRCSCKKKLFSATYLICVSRFLFINISVPWGPGPYRDTLGRGTRQPTRLPTSASDLGFRLRCRLHGGHPSVFRGTVCCCWVLQMPDIGCRSRLATSLQTRNRDDTLPFSEVPFLLALPAAADTGEPQRQIRIYFFVFSLFHSSMHSKKAEQIRKADIACRSRLPTSLQTRCSQDSASSEVTSDARGESSRLRSNHARSRTCPPGSQASVISGTSAVSRVLLFAVGPTSR